jgi:GT2 family glycosyltransferase
VTDAGGEGPPVAISVVICSRDRVGALAVTLDRYRDLLAEPDWELVVVDDGSRDSTGSELERRRPEFQGRLAIRRTEGVGLGAARNIGWRSAAGLLIHFTDDDCHPAPDLMAQIRVCFAEGGIDFLGGRLLPFGPEDAGVAVVTRERRTELVGPQFVPAGFLPGANLTVRRSALELVGGFDPELGAGTPFPAEDVELIARLLASGCRGRYDPRPVVWHRHGRATPASREALTRAYDRGRGAYYAKLLANPSLRWSYLRAWIRSARRGSWRATWREVRGAWRYWTRPRSRPDGR